VKAVYLILKSRHLWGLTGTAFALYFLVFVVLGNIDVGWMLPTQKIANAILEVWPRLPFFAMQKESINGGKQQEIRYTVPTRQLTPQEIARMMEATNAAAHPVQPK
jgi:molecular chaperone DnaK (HSP70)